MAGVSDDMSRQKIFISYSHENEDWKDRLVQHLVILEARIDLWDDRRIKPGDDWRAEIDAALEAAQVAVLLISPDFLNSRFVRETEVPRLQERGIRMIPLIVRPCAWELVDWLQDIQAHPRDGRALSAGDDSQIDEDLAALTREIHGLVVSKEREGGLRSSSPDDPAEALADANRREEELVAAGQYTETLRQLNLRSEQELLQLVRDLSEILDQRGQSFAAVEFEVPGRETKLCGFWEEHLNHLQETGKIYRWTKDEQDGVVFLTLDDNGPHVTLRDSRLLSHETLAVHSITPLGQVPVPGSRFQNGDVLYPDLPLRGDYLDLVEMPDGTSLLTALKNGAEVESQWQPEVRRDAHGRQVLNWSLKLRGRSTPLPVEVRLEADEEPSRAHWMVWPGFRTRKGDAWKTYYVYQNSDNIHLSLDTLWLEGGDAPRVRRLAPPEDAVAYPVGYRTVGQRPAHAGGPPLAFCLCHRKLGEEQGLYLIPLRTFPEVSMKVSAALDFGTSHSVAAVRVGEERTQQVELLPELDSERAGQALTVHVSEDWSHVEASEDLAGILATGAWLPTYSTSKSKGFLPSELILYRTLEEAQADDVEAWVPVTNYLIPPMDIGRHDLASFLLTDFRRDTGSSHFRGREKELRENYLSLFLELVMADVVTRHAGGFPRHVDLTFTYPLRSSPFEIEDFQNSLKRIVDRSSESLGIHFALHDGIGILDKSHASMLTTERSGEICLIADLGGTTLDLFISAKGRAGVSLPKIVDSVRLGSDLLLGRMARSPDGLLPENGNWVSSSARDTETKLREWMRSKGSARLFGVYAGGRPHLKRMGLYGFDRVAEGHQGRVLLDRYFRLIAEFLARNLAAYLYMPWYPSVDPEDHGQLNISVQLRGSGWRLRYQDESFMETTEAIQQQVRQRLEALWEDIDNNPYPDLTLSRWMPASMYPVADPQAVAAVNAVGRSMPFEEVRKRSHSHTLVELDVIRDGGVRTQINWFDQIPFHTGGTKHVEIVHVFPPIVLSAPQEDKEVKITSLDSMHEGEINRALQGPEGVVIEGSYSAPVAALVWEAIFDSQAFWPGREENEP